MFYMFLKVRKNIYVCKMCLIESRLFNEGKVDILHKWPLWSGGGGISSNFLSVIKVFTV